MNNVNDNFDGFNQVVIWEATIVKEDQVQECLDWLSETFNASFKWIGSFPTNYSNEGEVTVDVAFFIHSSDVPKFALKRLEYGMRWLEDVLDNDPSRYPSDSGLLKYKSW